MKPETPPTEESVMEGEHQVQVGLIDLLNKAVKTNEPIEKTRKILDQLISYTEVHFMSEQLIMRQHSYQGFDEHDAEHDQLMEKLLSIKEQAETNQQGLDLDALACLKDILIRHIATQDRKLSRFLAAL